MAALVAPRFTREPASRGLRIYLTRNSEYFCRDGVCTRVRDLRTGEFRQDHPAIGGRITGSLRYHPEGSIESVALGGQEPHAGEHMFFLLSEAPAKTLMTSSLLRVSSA
jgi:hypothetical protein